MGANRPTVSFYRRVVHPDEDSSFWRVCVSIETRSPGKRMWLDLWEWMPDGCAAEGW